MFLRTFYPRERVASGQSDQEWVILTQGEMRIPDKLAEDVSLTHPRCNPAEFQPTFR